MGLSSITTEKIANALVQHQSNAGTSDFDLNKGLRPVAPRLRDAAVLIPLIKRAGILHVILTVRSSHLKHHAGQVAFPGGKVDSTDADALDTALREAHEEIGLAPNMVQVLGKLPHHETVTSFHVTPYVGLVAKNYHPTLEPGEVDEIFEVPVSLFLAAENFQIHSRVWFGIERRYFAVPYGPYYTWGATARILRMFCNVIGEYDETIR